MPKKFTLEDFIKACNLKHNNLYDYTMTTYKNMKTPIVVTCPVHGQVTQIPQNHLRQGCHLCNELIKNNKQNEFIEKAKIKHGDFYDYSNVEYIDTQTKVSIICPSHGEFKVSPRDHLRYTCKKCYHDSMKYNLTDFIRLSQSIHGNKYDYKEVSSLTAKIKIICNEHGPFYQQPRNHIAGQGCRSCARRYTTEQFIQKAQQIHNNRYQYDVTVYEMAKTKVNIRCNIHGIFEQNASSHLCGVGCPSCNWNISNAETAWLNKLGIKTRNKVITTNTGQKFKVDGYDEETKTVYEFNGDYWHGNPKVYPASDIHPTRKITFGELYEATILKQKILEENGYTVVSIWESDFLT